LSVTAGTVIGRTIAMGGQLNTVAVNGTATNPANVTGAITQLAGGTLALSVNNGTLIDLNPALAQATHSINVGATGVLNVTADPLNNRNTQFVLTGPSATATIASGGQIGLSMASLQTAAAQNYIVIAGAPGSITAAGLGAASIGNTPFLYTATAAFVASDPAHGGQSEVQLTVDRKTAQQLGFNAAEASAFNAVLGGLSTQAAADQGLQSALLAQTTQTGLKSVYDQLLPNQGQGIFQALDAAVERVSAFVGTPPDNATHIGGSSLWVQEVNERVERSGIDTLGSKSQLFGVVGGYERMGAGGGALGVSLGYFNVQENDSASQLGSRDVASLIEGSVYYRRSFGNLTFAARGGGGFGWFSSNRIFAYLQTYDIAQSNWTGAFIDGHVGLAYEVKLFGGFYARPEVSLDYLDLHQGSFQEAGATTSMNLHVTPHNDTQFSGQGLMVLGRQWGKGAWFRSELRLGYREVIEGQVGDTTASFANGTPFTLAGDPDKGGWATVGFSLKTGSEFSYLALEGDADFRKGQRRYDLRVAGRSVF
jgi:hypothetical protein